MFEFSVKKEDFLIPLLTVAGAVDKKQSSAILSHFLLKLSKGLLFITSSGNVLVESIKISTKDCDFKIDQSLRNILGYETVSVFILFKYPDALLL